MKYNFDEVIGRKGTNAMSKDGYIKYLFSKKNHNEIRSIKDDFISMWVADMDFAVAPEIIKAIKTRLDHRILGYSQIYDPKYKESFCEWAKSRYDWECNKDHIVTSHGVIPALYDLIEIICNPDDKILIMTPSYGFFKHAADFHNIELLTTDLIHNDGYYRMDFDDIGEKIKDDKVTLCIFCNPHNPTGRVWTKAELVQFGQLCLKNDVTIISDEIHCDILRAGIVFSPLAKLFPESDRIITCMAPSKTFNLAGTMLANIIIPDIGLRSKWNKRHISLDNPLSITAVQAAYTYGHDWLNELTIYLDGNFEFLQKYLTTHLPKARFRISEATYLAWIDIGAYFPKEENLTLFFAKNAGVLLEGGNMFVSNADGFIRLNLACPKSKLKNAIKRITDAILSATF